jgi:hypothetical protein
MKTTRLFYVVESEESNPEIFIHKEDALKNARDWKRQGDINIEVSIKEVKNWFQEKYGDEREVFNYDDYADTFNTIKIIKTL